jgi:glycosidase
MNSTIKIKYPDAFLLAEVYNPTLYRDYIHIGKMDYLYDKVALYDTIKHIVRGHGLTDNIPQILEDLSDIEHQMIHFLENHDEQRIASADFAGSAEKGKPAMLVSTTISTSPTLIYFGQDVGEPGNENAGFGTKTRTSMFDYIGVPNHQRWMNNKKFDGGQLTNSEKELHNFYKRLLNFTINSSALMGDYREIHSFNRKNSDNYNHRVFSFVRWSANEKLIIISNFDEANNYSFDLKLPKSVISAWKLKNGSYQFKDQLNNEITFELLVEKDIATMQLTLEPLASLLLRMED